MNPTQENPSQELDVIGVAVTSAQKQALAGTITINLVFPQLADAIGQDDDAFRDHLEKVVVSAEGGDAGAPFEKLALDGLRILRETDPAEWVRFRKRLKAAGVSVTELEKRLGAIAGTREDPVTDKLIDLARQCCTFFHDAQGQCFASFDASGARQVYALDSSGFQSFLAYRFYTEFDRSPSEQALRNAMVTLSGDAKFKGEERTTYVRVAKTAEGYWLDLCDPQWRCVRITAKSWEVMAGEDVPLFTRTTAMQPLPMPVGGGNLDELWKMVNIPAEDRILALAWLLECLRPETPHVVLELVGEQGSAKSSAQRVLRRLIDPNQSDLRTAGTIENLWVTAGGGHVVSLENLSVLSTAMQDALCTLSTGGGYATRKLYTNNEEAVINLVRPVVLNGINAVVTRQDLLDRSIHIRLPQIVNRALAADIGDRFKEHQPMLLGALLDLMVKTLQILPEVDIPPDKRPRMADFALLGEAVSRAVGSEPGEYAEKYAEVRKEGVLRTIEASPVGVALMVLLGKSGARTEKFHGTMAELRILLEPLRSDDRRDWPQSPKGMGDALRRLAPALRVLGYECVDEEKRGGVRRWRISQTPEVLSTSHESPASLAEPESQPSPTSSINTPDGSTGLTGHAGHGLESSTPQKEKHPAAADDAEEF